MVYLYLGSITNVTCEDAPPGTRKVGRWIAGLQYRLTGIYCNKPDPLFLSGLEVLETRMVDSPQIRGVSFPEALPSIHCDRIFSINAGNSSIAWALLDPKTGFAPSVKWQYVRLATVIDLSHFIFGPSQIKSSARRWSTGLLRSDTFIPPHFWLARAPR